MKNAWRIAKGVALLVAAGAIAGAIYVASIIMGVTLALGVVIIGVSEYYREPPKD